MKVALKYIFCSAILSSCFLQGKEGYTNYIRMVEIGDTSSAGFIWDLQDADDQADDFLVDNGAVSYTHLTLPTNREV